MTETNFLHDAIDKLTVAYVHIYQLHGKARSHIQEEGAMEVRDLCEDLIHKIDMFKMNKQLTEKFSKTREVA
jgi:hypothetical protein